MRKFKLLRFPHIAVIIVAAVIILSLSPFRCMGAEQPKVLTRGNVRLLSQLDSLLEQRGIFVKQKEERLSELRTEYTRTTDPSRLYWIANALYEEYAAYDSDSAMAYTSRAIALADRLNRPDLAEDMRLNRAYLYSATGLLDEAGQLLAGMKVDTMPVERALRYYDRMLFLSTHRDQYMGIKYETAKYSASMDSLLHKVREDVSPDSPQYIWLTGWSSLNSPDEAREALKKVRGIVESTGYYTRSDAKDAWVLAQLYERVDDRENYLRFLILSAMADVRASNKEVASLEEIALVLFGEGDYEHANSYLNYCITWANEYKSRVRIGQLADLQRRTLQAIHEQMERQADANRIYVWILVFATLVLIVLSLLIWRQNRKLHQSRRRLSEANTELHGRVDELQRTREELKETNGRLRESYDTARSTARQLAEINDSKEAYIANIFAICSSYITSHEEFRARLQKLLSNRKFDDALQVVKSPELSYEETKELCSNFDHIFLQIYPDFVADLNTLLRPDEQIKLRNPETLTTEVRIQALVRLGLTDTPNIARFLRCSVQTVYNARMRMRNKAAVPKEEFEQKVRTLGRPSI